MEPVGFYNINHSTINFSLDIVDQIIKLSQTLTSLRRSNKGGWQGLFHENDFDWFLPVLQNIKLELPNYYIHSCWFNINGPEHYNHWHRHTPRELVGVLYLEVPKNSGEIEFRERGKCKRILPQVGQLITFPGSLEHRVLENKSLENRISVAINFEKV